MKKTIVFLFTLLTIAALGQDSFIIHKQGVSTFNKPKDLCIKPDGNMLFLFLSNPTGPSDIYSNYLYEVNQTGDIVDSISITDTNSKWFELNHCYFSDDTIYLFGSGTYFEPPQETFLSMMKLDTQFNLLESFTFRPGIYNFAGTFNGELKLVNDVFYYITAAISSSTGAPFCAEISKQGEMLRFGMDYNYPNSDIVPCDFKNPNIGEGYKVFFTTLGFSGYPSIGGLIGYFNPDFQLEECHEFPYYMFSHLTYQSVNDSVYYLAGEWRDFSSANSKRAGILKIKNDTTILCEYLHTTYPDSSACPAYRHSLETLPDGNLIFCFTDNIDLELFPSIYPAKINLMKLTPELEIVWHQYIGDNMAKWDAFEMHVNEQEEIVIHAAYNIADISQLLNRDVLFIKTNSEGIITGTNQDLPGVQSSEVLLYPNPASDMVAIEYSMAYTGASLEIINISGQKVFATQLTANRQGVDISGIPPGTYVYRIFNKQGLDESGKLVVE